MIAVDQSKPDEEYLIRWEDSQNDTQTNAMPLPASSFQDMPKKTKRTKDVLVQKLIGTGAFGHVYKAVIAEEKWGHPICLKMIHHKNLNCLTNENYILGILDEYSHESIIKRKFFCGTIDGSHWFLGLEYFKGDTLQRIIEKIKCGECRLTDEHLMRLLEQQAGALGHILSNGIFHCDIHPGNVMYDMESKCSKLIDFGCAVECGDRIKVPGGTMEYMAPEVLYGWYPRLRSDVYGLAATIHHLITLKKPWFSLQNMSELRASRNSVNNNLMEQMKETVRKEIRRFRCGQGDHFLAVQREVSDHGRCNDGFKSILLQMLNSKWRERPTCEEVLTKLSELELITSHSAQSNDGNNIAALRPPSADSTSANYYKSENIAVKSTRLTARPINSTPEAMDTSSSLEGAQTSAYQPEDSDDSDDL